MFFYFLTIRTLYNSVGPYYTLLYNTPYVIYSERYQSYRLIIKECMRRYVWPPLLTFSL